LIYSFIHYINGSILGNCDKIKSAKEPDDWKYYYYYARPLFPMRKRREKGEACVSWGLHFGANS
jgi:hypothetical protein